MQFKFSTLFGAASLLFLSSSLLSSCGEASFKVNGIIDGASHENVVLEKSDFHGRWIVVDSMRTSESGQFSFKRPAPAAPEIFRLELGNRYIYFPVDSTEAINVETTLDGYGRDYTLSGSEKAVAMAAFDHDLMALPADVAPDSLDAFKRSVYSKYMRDAQGSIVSYYALTKLIGDKPLFDPETDYKYFAAVATGFKSARPDDPRTPLLEATSVNSIKKRNAGKGIALEIDAEEIKVLDIELPDEEGKTRHLTDYVGNGKPVVVMFSLLTHPDSPAFNMELSKLYNRYGGNVEFFQVSLDPDQYDWRDAARNLPWVTVYDADGQYSRAARTYNVSDLPTFFLYDRNGELAGRAASIDELSRLLAK